MKTGPYLGDEPTPWQLQFTESFSKISTVNHGKDVAKPRSCQRHQSKQRGLPLWTPSGGRWEEMSAGHCQSHTSAFFPFLWKKVVSTRYAFLLFFSHIYVTRESNPSKKKLKLQSFSEPSHHWNEINEHPSPHPRREVPICREPWKGIESKVFWTICGKGIAEGRVGSQCKDADTTAHQNGDVEDDIYSALWLRCPQY